MSKKHQLILTIKQNDEKDKKEYEVKMQKEIDELKIKTVLNDTITETLLELKNIVDTVIAEKDIYNKSTILQNKISKLSIYIEKLRCLTKKK